MVEDLPKAVVLDDSLMISQVVLGNARDHIENWYKAQALEYITQRVEYYAQMTGLKYHPSGSIMQRRAGGLAGIKIRLISPGG